MTFTCSELGLLVTGTRPALSATLGSRGLPHLKSFDDDYDHNYDDHDYDDDDVNYDDENFNSG